MTEVEGLLLLDKPPGPTSHDLVDRVRRLTGQRRVGHAGTLDPIASGLLPLVLGRATRLVRFLPHSPKLYAGTLQLGLETVTDDRTGEPRYRHTAAPPSLSLVAEVAGEFLGQQMQTPPLVSARKSGGRRAYDLVRQGVSFEPSPTPVTIQRFQLAASEDPSVLEFQAEVSAGTYIRALVRDLGRRLGCGATLLTLRRLQIGPLAVESALDASLPDLASRWEAALIPIAAMPLVPPEIRLADDQAKERFLRGLPVLVAPSSLPADCCRVLDQAGEMLGIGAARDGWIQPRVVLSEARRAPDPAV